MICIFLPLLDNTVLSKTLTLSVSQSRYILPKFIIIKKCEEKAQRSFLAKSLETSYVQASVLEYLTSAMFVRMMPSAYVSKHVHIEKDVYVLEKYSVALISRVF